MIDMGYFRALLGRRVAVGSVVWTVVDGGLQNRHNRPREGGRASKVVSFSRLHVL